MKEYLEFINRYQNDIKENIDYNDYKELKSQYINTVNNIMSLNNLEIDSYNSLVIYTMFIMLKNHNVQDLLKKDYTNEIDQIVKFVVKKRSEKVKTDSSIDYIKSCLKRISFIFDNGMNYDEIASNIKESLIFDGYQVADITRHNCDQAIFDYIRNGYFDIKFNNEFKDLGVSVSRPVNNVFMNKKQGLSYGPGKDNLEYMYYTDRNNQSRVIFNTTVSLMQKGYTPGVTSLDSGIYDLIEKNIRKDLMTINSTRVRPETEFEKYMNRTPEKKAADREFARKAAIGIAIAFSLLAIDNIVYNATHPKEKPHEDNKPKKSYYAKGTSYNIDKAADKIMSSYNYENNEFVLEGENVANL